MVSLIQLRGLAKHYLMGDTLVKALDAVDLDIEKNELLAIMGQSGSGKSTLMNLIGCLDTPTSGSYTLGGREIQKLTDNALAAIRNKEIGFVFQTFNLLPRTDAFRNVELPLVYSGLPAGKRHEMARKALEAVGLGDRMRHKPNEMSGGQRQRVAVARALVNNPTILLADEPTGNLDSKTGDEILELFHELHRRGQTVIIVTHEEHIARTCSRIVRMQDGRVISDTAQKH